LIFVYLPEKLANGEVHFAARGEEEEEEEEEEEIFELNDICLPARETG